MEKYSKIKKIGEGSFGKAILVKHKESGEQFVVKEIGISKMQPKERNEARKEVLVLSKMRHPNIVQYTESFEENGHLYIIMEYCEGGDLYALINKQRGIPFPERQVLSWFVQLCLALKHVHDRKILHRDIKTSNIFLTKSGAIKLGDFGIARVLNNTMELARTCIGTPYYLSPEICENKPYNNKSDVWALGCVVYETLTLKHAFEAGNMKNLVLKIIRGSYPPVPSRYSYDLRTLVSQLFRRNPRERPSINSILRKPLIAPLTAEHLSAEQHEEEFSHTVLHKGRKPSSRPSSANPSRYQPLAAITSGIFTILIDIIILRYNNFIFTEKRPRNLELQGAQIAPKNRRAQQMAAAYGPSVARKAKPRRVVNAQNAVDNVLERKRQQLMEEEKKRVEKIGGNAKEAEGESNEDEGRSNEEKAPQKASDRDRPISAPKERGDYEKYHDFLNSLNMGTKSGTVLSMESEIERHRSHERLKWPFIVFHIVSNRAAANAFPQPGLDKVRAAWEERKNAQDAARFAHVNRMAAEKAAERAEIVNEYLQRKEEARMNKHKGNAGEQEYLAKLQKIRAQNYNDRKSLFNKVPGKKEQYKVEASDPSSDENRKAKIAALQQQAADRAQLLQKNMERRREILDAKDEERKKHGNMAKARGVVHPDERPVKYNPAPIGITQALLAVGAPIPSEDPVIPAAVVSSPKVEAEIKKKVLQRVNQRFSTDFEAEIETPVSLEKRHDDSSEKEEPKSSKLETKNWGAGGDIGLEIAGLPLQETTSVMEATNAIDDVTMVNQPVKKGWEVPSGTFVHRLNQLTIHQPTMTLPPDENGKEIKDSEEELKPIIFFCRANFFVLQKLDPESPVNNKTTVIHKSTPTHSNVANQPGIQMAANFKLVPNLGTYVIPKTPEVDGSKSQETIQSVPAETVGAPAKPPLNNMLSKPPSGLDDVIEDDMEEVELVNETKSTSEQKNQQAVAWSKEMKPDQTPAPNTPSERNVMQEPKSTKPEASYFLFHSHILHQTLSSDQMLKKITLGQFDSPNPKLLRTCSLPDLATCVDVRMSVASSMNDTNFDEDEVTSLPDDTITDADDEEMVATDDEDMSNLRANMESFLQEPEDDNDSSPSFSAHQSMAIVLPDDVSDDVSDDVDNNVSDDNDDIDEVNDDVISENGDWDSEEPSETESIFCRLEHSREELERELGMEAFLKAYRYIQAIHEDEDESVSECEDRVRSLLGARHDDVYQRILQLVMADGAYCEDNTT
uniref:non-specific serine/threonine protein kinase n=1 Tax=Ciona intestinalis TaxID=7719 RepID=F7ACS2_CIOIN